MNRGLIVVLIVLGAHGNLQAQTRAIDSLKRRLTSSDPDTQKVRLLNELASRHLAFQPDPAKAYAEQALVLAQALKDHRGELAALLNLCDYYFRQSQYARAVELGTLALREATRQQDSLAMGAAYRFLGNTHNFGLKEYAVALDYQKKALALWEKKRDTARLAALYGSLTWIYAITGQELALAHEYTNKGLALSKQIGSDQLLSYNLNSKAMIYMAENKLDSAYWCFEQSNAAAARAVDLTVIAYNKSMMGNILLGQKQYDRALALFAEAEAESRRQNAREVLKDVYLGRSKVHQARREFEQALRAFQRYTQLKDSLLNWETTQKSLTLINSYEQEKKEARIVQLQQENALARAEKRLYLMLLVAGVGTLLIITALVMHNARQRKRANEILKEKNEEIEAQNEELLQSQQELAAQRDIVQEQNKKLLMANQTKSKLFSIISHDLRGPIGNLKTLLQMLTGGTITPEEFQSILPNLSHNVTHLHQTLENLLQWSYTQMKGLTYDPKTLPLHELVQQNIYMFQEVAATKRIALKNDVPPDMMIYADENQLRLILRNLISNALKFTSEAGVVAIAAEHVNHETAIRVIDTGVGMTQEQIDSLYKNDLQVSSAGTRGEKGTGLGLMLCKEMAANNKGRLEINSQSGKGSIFTLYLNKLNTV
jgi:signal transduction histidine kinase